MKRLLLFFSILFSLILLSCNTSPPPSTPINPSPTQSNVNNEGYPAPTETSSGSGYPALEEAGIAEIVKLPIPDYANPNTAAPESGKGTVIGRVLSNIDNAPISNIELLVGVREPMNPGPGHLITVMENNAPRGISDSNGYFVIENLDPDTYSLVLFTPIGSQVLSDIDGAELDVVILSDQITDLVDIFIQFP